MTKEIIIPWKEEVFTVLVDDDSYTLLNRHTWYIMFSGKHKKPYAFTEIFSRTQGKRMVYMHHFVLGGFILTDHRNSNTLDNQYHNLREATKSQNGGNCVKMKLRKGKPTSSKYKGVHWAATQCKYRAVIKCQGKLYHLGSFDDEDEAAHAYNQKSLELFGEYAKINEINHSGCTRDTVK